MRWWGTKYCPCHYLTSFPNRRLLSTHPSDSVYLPGRTSVQLTAFDRHVVNDQKSQDYTITINKEDGCDYDKLAVTLVWVEPGKLLLCIRVLSWLG